MTSDASKMAETASRPPKSPPPAHKTSLKTKNTASVHSSLDPGDPDMGSNMPHDCLPARQTSLVPHIFYAVDDDDDVDDNEP